MSTLNPWKNIWFRPKQTIDAVNKEDPNKGLLFFSTLSGLWALFVIMNRMELGKTHPLWLLLLGSVVCAPFFGRLLINIQAAILYLAVDFIQEKHVPFSHYRSVIAWAYMPAVFFLLAWVFSIIFRAEQAFIQVTVDPTVIPLWVSVATSAAIFGVLIWMLAILVAGLRALHKLSVGRCFKVLLALLVLYIIIVAEFF